MHDSMILIDGEENLIPDIRLRKVDLFLPKARSMTDLYQESEK
jgi:hypothetical protein